MRLIVLFIIVTVFIGCAQNQKITQLQGSSKNETSGSLSLITEESDYGYTKLNPIKVGGGISNVIRFFNALKGPHGQLIRFRKIGSCCYIETPRGSMGGGLLDMYEVRYKGLKKPIVLYFNKYDYEPLQAPKGFTIKTIYSD